MEQVLQLKRTGHAKQDRKAATEKELAAVGGALRTIHTSMPHRRRRRANDRQKRASVAIEELAMDAISFNARPTIRSHRI